MKACKPVAADGEVLAPGEPERKTRAERLANGIPLDENTIAQMQDAARKVGVAPAEIDALVA
jgi:uncharacterized oxidoreductase